MKIQNFNANLPVINTKPVATPQKPEEKPETLKRSCKSPSTDTVDFNGPRPAHRMVKKISRAAAGAVGVAGLAKIGYDLATSGSLEVGLAKAALTLLGTGAAIVGMDLVSGMWHHKGDNYGSHAQTLKHTKWHTNTHDSDYCLIGVSNKALDKIGFWPKYEKAVYNTLGAEPVAWKVEPYKNFALGKISQDQLTAELAKLGMPQ